MTTPITGIEADTIPRSPSSAGIEGREDDDLRGMVGVLPHIPLIHVSALAVQGVRDGAVHPEFYTTAPYTWMPDEFEWSLGLLHLVFAVDFRERRISNPQ